MSKNIKQLSIKEYAYLSKCSVQNVYQQLKKNKRMDGVISHIKIGSHYILSVDTELIK